MHALNAQPIARASHIAAPGKTPSGIVHLFLA
jgi:hypothetical protein